MLKALYYPHTDIANPTILNNALLLWDSIETIVPHSGWNPSTASNDKLYRDAVDLIVRPRVPTELERRAAHKSLLEMNQSGLLSSLIASTLQTGQRREYLIYPEKFLKETWRMLEQHGMARWIQRESDYGVPAGVGFLMMSILAEQCAGTQIRLVTDRTVAYRWLSEMRAKALGTQLVENLDASQVAPRHDRLVALSLDVLDGRQVPLKKLVEMRKRETRTSGADYSALRRRYIKALESHIDKIGKEAKSVSDVKELDRQFKEDIKQDMADLKAELGIARSKSLFSKEVALGALILAGCLISPVAGLTALSTNMGAIGIIPLMNSAVKYRAARRDELRKHTMSWLYISKQPRLASR